MDKHKIHLEHVLESIGLIYEFTKDISDYESFHKDIKTVYAVERCLETMTQSIKDLGDEVYQISGTLDWRAIAGMRDILAHHYMVLAHEIIWDVIQNKIPELEVAFRRYMKI